MNRSRLNHMAILSPNLKVTHENTISDANCHIIKLTRGSSRLHWHDNVEIAFSLEGFCHFLVDGTLYKAEPGDMVVIGPHIVHQFFPISACEKFVVLQLAPQNLKNIHVSPYRSKTFITRKELSENPILLHRIDTLFEWLLADPGSTVANIDPAQQALCLYLYCSLARHFPNEALPYSSKVELQEFHTIFHYVRKHFKENITVSSIASALYVNRNKVSQLFLKYAATSLSDYIRDLRIDNAKLLLSAGTSIIQAALESGFQSVRTFNDNFRQHTGITPSEYVKNNSK